MPRRRPSERVPCIPPPELRDPHPDETAYSWVARHHWVSGNARGKDSASLLLGGHETLLPSYFPKWIGSLCREGMAASLGYSQATVTETMTLLPYVAPFVSPGTHADLLRRMTRGHEYSWHRDPALRRLTWDRVRVRRLLRYCPECCEEDANAYGRAYWHRSHQLFCVRWCHKHGGPLVEHPVRKDVPAFVLPPVHVSGAAGRASQSFCSLPDVRFARFSHELLTANGEVYGPGLLKWVYMNRAFRFAGILEPGPRPCGAVVRDRITATYGQQFLEQHELTFLQKPEAVLDLLRTGEACIPAHVVVASCLFDSASEFLWHCKQVARACHQREADLSEPLSAVG